MIRTLQSCDCLSSLPSIRTPLNTRFASRSTSVALAGYITLTPFSSTLLSNHLQNLSGSICAVVPSLDITSMMPSFVLLNHSGPLTSSSQGRLWVASCARLVPFSSQSSPDPEMADSESWDKEMPVDCA